MHLELILKVQDKLGHYKIVTEEDFEQTEKSLSRLNDEIQKIEESLKSSINNIQCDYSNTEDPALG